MLQRGIDFRMGGDYGALVPVASCQVLRGNDGHLQIRRVNKDEFGMVVGKKTVIDGLHDERPQTQRLIGCFVIEQQLDIFDLAASPHVVQPPDKLLGDREGCLSNGGLARHLSEAPFHYVGHLQLIAQVCLCIALLQGMQDAFYCPTYRHPE